MARITKLGNRLRHIGGKRAVRRPHRACLIRFQTNDKAAIREAEALYAAGFEVDVLLVREEGGPKQETINGVRYVHLPLQKQRATPVRYVFEYASWFILCAAWMIKESPRQRFNYVQVDSLPDHQIFAAAIPKLLGAKLALFVKEPTEQLYYTMYGSTRLASCMAWLARRAIDFADVAFCVTDLHKDSLIATGVDADKLHVVLNAMPPFPEAVRTRKQNDGGFVVVCHGTIEERYGHDSIIEAAAKARDVIPGLRVRLPGKGTYAGNIEALIDELDLNDVVSLDGWLSDEDLAQLLADSDVGLVAQLANPYSHLVHTTKMYDFMQASVPVVASRLNATQELFPTEITYFTAGDADDLAKAWQQLAESPDRREQQVSESLRRLRHLGWETQVDRFIDVVNDTCRSSFELVPRQ